MNKNPISKKLNKKVKELNAIKNIHQNMMQAKRQNTKKTWDRIVNRTLDKIKPISPICTMGGDILVSMQRPCYFLLAGCFKGEI